MSRLSSGGSDGEAARSPPPLVYVVDDHPEMCASIEALLCANGFRVKCYEDPKFFLDQLRDLASGLILLDLRMPSFNGLDVLDRIQPWLRSYPVIMITGHGEIEDAVRAIKAGAKDFIQKPFHSSELLEVIRREWKTLNARAANEHVTSSLDKLTPRERDVVLALASGKPNKVIAHQLNLSVRTVEMHRARAMQRLNCQNFADLLRTVFADSALQDTKNYSAK